MAEDKGKKASDSKAKAPDLSEKENAEEKDSKRSKERVDYAKKMWSKIRESNASKDERGDLKDRIADDDTTQGQELDKEKRKEEAAGGSEGDKPKKKRRRRRRRKKKPVEEGEGQKVNSVGSPKVDSNPNPDSIAKSDATPKTAATPETTSIPETESIPEPNSNPEVALPTEPNVQSGPAAAPTSLPEAAAVVPPINPFAPLSETPFHTEVQPQSDPQVTPATTSQAVPPQEPEFGVQPSTQVDEPVQAALPPQEYEDRYQMEADDEGGQDSDSDAMAEAVAAESEASSVPENPFANPALDDFSPLPDSAFDDRPLEAKSEVQESDEMSKDSNDESVEAKDVAIEQRNVNEETGGSGDTDVSETETVADGSTSETETDDFAPDASKVEVADVKTTSEETASTDETAVEAEVVESEAEVVPGTVVGDVPSAADSKEKKGEEMDAFKEDFWEILEQAGISKKTLLIFIVVLAVLITGFVIFLFSFGGDDSVSVPTSDIDLSDDSEVVNGDNDDSEVTSSNDGETSFDSGSVPYEIVSSYIFGLEYNPEASNPIEADPIVKWADDSGIEAALLLGDSQDILRIEFIEMMDLLRKMENIFNTDVYALVNLSTERSGILEDHIDQMRGVIEEGEDAVARIDASLESMSAEFQSVALTRDSHEVAFFEFSDQLYGQNAYENLEKFIELSERTNEIKAQFEAKKLLREKFILSLEVLIPRYEDIVANKEALLKGVRVFDVPGSNIDAIVPLTE